MAGLTELLEGLRCRGDEIWVAICTAGDRTDGILHAFALRAALGSDHLAIAELLHYLRGRPREAIVDELRAGAREAGVEDVPEYEDELHALRAMVHAAGRGDVVGVTALGMRPELFAWLEAAGARRLEPADVRRLVRRAVASKRPGGASLSPGVGPGSVGSARSSTSRAPAEAPRSPGARG
jgi:hypothetical protein